MTRRWRPSRRSFLKLAGSGALALALPSRLRGVAPAAPSSTPAAAAPFPLETVRLLPSPYLDAVLANRDYLHQIEPDRLLHNYRKHAGLSPRGSPTAAGRRTPSPGTPWATICPPAR